jgi:acyl-coenzyme A thioesterase PaaI-like protein
MSGEVDDGVNMEPWRESGSFVLDMDVSSLLVSRTRCLLHAPLSRGVSTRSGAASLGWIVSALDIAAADPALASCRPDWTATQDLTVHATGRLVDGPLVVDAQLVRVGKKTITVATNVYDGHGVNELEPLRRAIDGGGAAAPGLRSPAEQPQRASTDGPTLSARGLVTFARIPAASAAGMDDYDPGKWLGQIRRRTCDRTPTGTLQARMGLRIVDAASGVAELPRSRYVTNSIGTIFGGAQATLLQLAAEAMRPGLEATDLQIHYLSQAKAGPARTLGGVSRDAADHSVVTLQLLDAGNDDQRLALATVLLQRPPS